MAKKKKHSKSKKTTKEEPKNGSPFLRITLAIILIILALFMLIGAFGLGGSLPVGLHEITAWAFGVGSFVVPFILIYLAVMKIKSENNKIPATKLLGAVFLMLMFSGMVHALVAENKSESAANDGIYGGMAGHMFRSLFGSFLTQPLMFIMFLFLMLAGVMFTFGITPTMLFEFLAKPFKRSEDTDLATLKNNADNKGFQTHEGVPVEHSTRGNQPQPRLSTFKNTAQKMSGSEDHEALTAPRDPDWKFPGLDLLNQKQDKADAGDVEGNARTIKDTLAHFNIDVEMESANIGPRVTQYTLKPPAGIKLSKITGVESNIALDLAAQTIRMEAPIPGKRAVGIEVPNVKAATVRASSVLSSNEWEVMQNPLSITIGKDISGHSIIGALDSMPHLLIAGQTGSGKSVMINLLLTSLLYRNSPADLKLILVDPKRVELTPYNDIPHLLTPVIVDPEKCISALKWAVAEMDRRYRTLEENKKRNIAEYNKAMPEAGMPYIVIVIDELADMMMMAARDVEALIVRLAQKARAVGIHLVLATQRPSVDVITGLIKANIPARIAFTVASQVDSRTIIDGIGAEKLLGQGDMLYSTADMPKPRRVQGALITDDETMKITDFLRMQRAPDYNDEIISQPVQLGSRGGGVVVGMGDDSPDEGIFRDAVGVVIEARKASTSLLQRRLRIGYGRAARIIEEMEERGIIGPADGSRPREVLITSMDEMFGSPEPTAPEDSSIEDEVYSDMSDDEEK